MDTYTSTFVDTDATLRTRFEEIELRSNSFVVAFDPFVSVLDPRVYLPIVTIRNDYDNVCNNVNNVEEQLEIDLVHRVLVVHLLH